jgi:16S rRNA (guanine1207-N2)-methyltransferase
MDPESEEGGPEPSNQQYFAVRPRTAHRRRELRFLYRGQVLTFETDAGVFAAERLDPGSALLISAIDPAPDAQILDLGCGWGPLGLAAARAAPQGRVVMTDVNRRALGLARQNARRNRIENVEARSGSLFAPVAGERFHLIVTNPPYHAGRETIVRLLSEAPGHLAEGGRLLLVGKGSQGIQFYQRWIAEHWPGGTVSVVRRGSGYRVLEARPAPANRQA